MRSLSSAERRQLIASVHHMPGKVASSLLVEVSPGGSATPLFFLPPIDMLHDALGCDRPVYGLPDGRIVTDEPETLTAALAGAMLESIRSVQPHGPYYLGGHCFAGLVALEMAQRLEQEGETVALLVLIEATRPGPRYLATMGISKALKLLLAPAKGGAEIRRAWSALSKSTKLSLGQGVSKLEGRVVAASRRARSIPVRGHFHGPTALFYCRDGAHGLWLNRVRWRRVLRGSVVTQFLPGTHRSCVHTPEFGEMLRACLEASDTSANTSAAPSVVSGRIAGDLDR